MILVVRCVAVPLLVVLYFAAGIPLALRNVLHVITYSLDGAFDVVAKIAGWDTAWWPFPRASDSPLPWSEDALE